MLKPYFAINSNHTDSVANLVLLSFAINVMPFYTFCPYTNTRFLPVGLLILARVGISTISFVIIRHVLVISLCYPPRPSLLLWSNVRKGLEVNDVLLCAFVYACLFFRIIWTYKTSWKLRLFTIYHKFPGIPVGM